MYKLKGPVSGTLLHDDRREVLPSFVAGRRCFVAARSLKLNCPYYEA